MILFRSLLHRFFRYGINGNISKRKPWIVVQASLMQLHKWRSQLRGSLFTWFHFPQFICIIYFISISHKKFCVTSADKRFWCWKLWILTLIWYGNFTIFSSLFNHHNDSVYAVSLMDSLTIICLYYYPQKVCNFQMQGVSN